MKKTLTSIILGIALLLVSRPACAESSRPAEPRWSIRPEGRPGVSPLDLARWLARRLLEVTETPGSTPIPQPVPATGGDSAPLTPDEVCVPERRHCPLG